VSLPEFDSASGYLPAGEHVATWFEVVGRFGWNSVRRAQLEGLCEALNLLSDAGCSRVWLNCSFVTSKEEPEILTQYGTTTGSTRRLLIRSSLIFPLAATPRKQVQRRAISELDKQTEWLAFSEFFQQDRFRRAKAIVVIDPRKAPK
jgi:hypothetical protein